MISAKTSESFRCDCWYPHANEYRDNVNKKSELAVRQQMLIRVPADRVFQAFVDPAVTTRFWLTHSDGPLEAGHRVQWEWRMYGAATLVRVVELEADKRIVIEWGDAANLSTVEWTFDARSGDTTLVTISNYGFTGTADEITAKAMDSMGGFSFVLAGAKAFLEHGIELNLVRDRAPDAHVGPDN